MKFKLINVVRIILLNLLLFFIIINVLPNNTKIEIRYALFSKFVNREQFLERKSFLIHDNSDFSNSYVLNKYKVKTSDTLLSILSKFNNFKKSSNNNNFSNNLTINITNVMDGRGFCSDYSQVFIALCNLNKYPVCEISNLNHTFNEIYDSKKKSFYFIDILNKIIAKDKQGNYLSTIEIKDKLMNNEIIEIFKFNNKKNIYSTNDHIATNYFSKDYFKTLILTNNKNVLDFDRKYYPYNFLPIELTQIIYAFHNYPLFLILDEHNSFSTRVLKMRFYIFTFLCLYLFVNFYIFKRLLYK